MSTRIHRIALTLGFTLAVGAAGSLGGCEAAPPGGLDIDPNAINVLMNGDPFDPHVAKIIAPAGEAHFYGTKDADGNPEHIEAIELLSADGVRYSMQFDDLDRPTFAADDQGNSATFSYTDTHLAIRFRSADGETLTETVALADIPDWPPTFEKPRLADKPSLDGADSHLPDGYKLVFVRVRVRSTYQGQVVGIMKNAAVQGFVDYGGDVGKLQFSAKMFNEDSDDYSYAFIHRSVPLSQSRQDCETFTTQGSRILTHAGTGMAIVGGLCFFGVIGSGGAATPLCAWLGTARGILTGIGVASGSSLLTEAGVLCQPLETPALPPTAHIRVYVYPPIDPPQVRLLEATVNLQDMPPPYNVLFDADFEVDAQVLDIGTSPAAPAASQSYQIIFTIAPLGASVRWSVSGSDGFSTSGVATADPNTNVAVSTSIPGGAEGVSDTLTAQVEINGVPVGPELSEPFTFR